MNYFKRFLILTFICFLPFSLVASTQNIVVVFLAESFETSSLEAPFYQKSSLFAMNDFSGEAPDNCVPRQGGCFHPQYGLIPYEDLEDYEGEKVEPEEKSSFPSEMKAYDMDVVDCSNEEDYFSSLYCKKGQAGEGLEPKTTKFHIWVDISTSMRGVDYSRDPNFCQRRRLVEKLTRDCPQRPSVSLFNTSLRPITDYSTICTFEGNNSTQRIIDWISRSTVENLLIISDVDEINPQLMDFLDSKNATIIGAGEDRIVASQMIDQVNELMPSCY